MTLRVVTRIWRAGDLLLPLRATSSCHRCRSRLVGGTVRSSQDASTHLPRLEVMSTGLVFGAHRSKAQAQAQPEGWSAGAGARLVLRQSRPGPSPPVHQNRKETACNNGEHKQDYGNHTQPGHDLPRTRYKRSAKDDMTIWPQSAATERDGAFALKLHAPSMAFILQLGIEAEQLL